MSVKSLKLYERYTREEVYEIFDGVKRFTQGSGTWGIHGIVPISKRKRDYVFFVTFGQKELGYDFEESITEDGILSWQSQPKMTLDHKTIVQLINHNHLIDNIYFFLRTRKVDKETNRPEPFTYLGRLAYLIHDDTREKPVYFKWQIIDWENRPSIISTGMNLSLLPVENDSSSKTNSLEETKKPDSSKEKTKKKRKFKARKIDYIENSKNNTELGLKGELLVMEYLINKLGYSATHTSKIEGDGAGYDIEVINNNGELHYIEVKTTKGGINTPFMVTPNELSFSEENENYYHLFRVYEYQQKNNSGKFYKLEGNLKNVLQLTPTVYKAEL